VGLGDDYGYQEKGGGDPGSVMSDTVYHYVQGVMYA